ncbi:MAG: hypothetical protein D6753_06560 [Planctomycetota bacterium]|nr:MAG: hypothetical protein D6753_06560 [Planctomycetota bacterium]
MRRVLPAIGAAYDRYLFASCSPGTCVVLRIVFGIAMTVYALVWWADGEFWFSDAGVMQAETARQITGGRQWSPLFSIPASPALVRGCLAVMSVNAVLMTAGVFSRWQAAMLFFWMVSFQHRNPLILDGEDTVFRLFAFYLMWMPMDARLSLWRALRGAPAVPLRATQPLAWPIRLMQLQMCFLYLSAAWSKWQGAAWRDGSALFYVIQMGDLFGRGWWPASVLESEALIRTGTWSVVVVEAALPLLLLLPRTRKAGVFLGIALHLMMEYSMHLFLFQWVMIIGLLSFLDFDRWVFVPAADRSCDGGQPVAGRPEPPRDSGRTRPSPDQPLTAG